MIRPESIIQWGIVVMKMSTDMRTQDIFEQLARDTSEVNRAIIHSLDIPCILKSSAIFHIWDGSPKSKEPWKMLTMIWSIDVILGPSSVVLPVNILFVTGEDWIDNQLLRISAFLSSSGCSWPSNLRGATLRFSWRWDLTSARTVLCHFRRGCWRVSH